MRHCTCRKTFVPYPNDRRKHDRAEDEPLSPEFLAMLVACGGDVREGDRSALMQAAGARIPARRADDVRAPDLPQAEPG
jgi:hypothetical protein